MSLIRIHWNAERLGNLIMIVHKFNISFPLFVIQDIPPPLSCPFLKCRTIFFFCFMSKTNIEIIWIEIPQVKGILLVCCIYRPPYSSSAFWQKLFWSFVQARDIFNIIVILGDLNIDVLKRNNSHEVDTIINSCRLTHIIHEPNKKYTQQ